MTPEQWRLISSAFHGALAQPPEGRQAFLNDACGTDAGVREEVERLLRAHQNAGVFGEAPVAELSAVTVPPIAANMPQAKSPVVFVALTWLMAIAALAAFTTAAWILVEQRGTAPWIGWDVTPRGGEWRINTVTRGGPAAGQLKIGDRLVSVNGAAPVTDAGIHFARRMLAIGTSYVVVVERDGQLLQQQLVVAGRANAGELVYFAVSLVWCALGLFIGFARPDSALARLGCLTAVAVGLVFLQVGVIHGGPLWQPLHTVLGFHFLARFPSGQPTRGVWKWMLRAAYATGAFSAVLGLNATSTLYIAGSEQAAQLMNEFASLWGLRRPAALLSFMIALLGMVLVLPYNYRRLETADQRRRVRWILYAGLVALVPQLWWAAVNALELFVGPPGVSRLDLFANGFTGVIPIAMAYAVLKHRVLDIKVVIRRGVQYLLARRALQLLTALPFIALLYTVVSNRHLTLEELLTQTGGYLFWLGVAAITLRFRTPIRLWLDRRFFREEHDRERLMLKMLDDSRRVESLHELSRLVSETLTAAMHPSRAYVWYRDPQELASTAASSPLLAPSDFPASERWLSWLEQRGATPLPVPKDAGLSQDDMYWLERRGIDLIVPIADSDDRLVGALLLGEKKSEQPYNDGDSRFLNAVAKQAAMIREHLRLRARLTEEVRMRHDVLARLDGTMPDLLKECPSCGACFSGDIERCPVDQHFLTLTLPVPRTIDTRYRLDRLIGKGGMGAVYEACDLRLDRIVALKIMLSRAFGQPGALRRFRREARTAARLSHPNIVAVFDVGSLEGEGAYIVMERVQGTTLRAAIERQYPMPHAELADWFEPLLNGIAAAHARGIVHRDLKPENVMGYRDPSGMLAVKILDLGLVKLRAEEQLLSGTMTAEGVIMGTPDYMSPEQLLGHDVDHRADIFALGVMLLEALTGHRAMRGEHRTRSLTPELHQLIARCLAVDPAERPASATELREALSATLRDSFTQRA
jgi:eukaryotic-like serine/threonine-protein kinase